MKQICSFFMLFISILFSCNNKKECVGIKNDKYSGYGIIFYHKLISGSFYEIIITPVCNDSTDLIEKIESNKNLKLFDGISTYETITSSMFAGVFKKARKISLLNNQTLTSQFKEIYASPVFIEFDNAQNDTKSTTSLNQNFLTKELIFANNNKLVLKYFLSNEIKIKNVRALE